MRGFIWNCEGEREPQGKKRLCFSPGVFSVCDPGQPLLCRKSSNCLQRTGLHRWSKAEALFADMSVSDICLSLDSFMLLQVAFFHSFLWLSVSRGRLWPHPYPFVCRWAFGLFLCPGHGERHCYEQGGAEDATLLLDGPSPEGPLSSDGFPDLPCLG